MRQRYSARSLVDFDMKGSPDEHRASHFVLGSIRLTEA